MRRRWCSTHRHRRTHRHEHHQHHADATPPRRREHRPRPPPRPRDRPAGSGPGPASGPAWPASSRSPPRCRSTPSTPPDVEGDPAAIVARLARAGPAILAFHTATMVGMALLVVFAAGLRRRLAGQLPSRSLLPDVAAAGLGLVAVAGLMGSGLTTEFVFGVTDPTPGWSRRPPSSSATGSAPSRGSGSAPASPASPSPSPPCATAPPRAGSAGSVRSSAGSPCCSASRRCSTWPA